MSSNEPSIFTKIINKEIPADIVYEDDQFIAFRDIKPAAPVHILIVPKQEHQTLESISLDDDAFHAQFLKTARKVAQQLDIADNYKLHLNVGKQVQEVQHVHLHLLGGWDKSKTIEELDTESRQL